MTDRYTGTAKTLHWLMAILLFGLLASHASIELSDTSTLIKKFPQVLMRDPREVAPF